MEATQQYRGIELTTPLGPDQLLIRDMSATEELGRLFVIDITLLSPSGDIRFEDLLGQDVTVRVDLPHDRKRYFSGYVSDFSQAVDEGRYAVYHATVRPWLWFLTRTSDCRIFQNKTVPDIIKQVFRDEGFTDFEDRLSQSYRTWVYCVQYRETDFNFVSRLMEQEGIYYYFKHENGKHTMILSDSYSAHEPIPGYETIPYYPPDSTVVHEDERIHKWSTSKCVQPGAYALDEFDFERPKTDLAVNSSIARTHTRCDYEIYDYPGEYVQTDHGNAYARTRIEEMHAHYEQAQADSDAKGIMPGGVFTFDEYPREDQNREYLVVAATHSARIDAYEASGEGGGMTYSNSFSVIESQCPFRSECRTPKPIVQGPQTAIVVGKSGEEIWTDEYGRVKLQFHWDRYGKSDVNASCWVRVAQLWAGKTWGGIHIPRIGQEVIVDFLEGDPDQPIITGRVYNADEMPPYELPANKTQSGIKSRSSQGGSGANFNEIRFEDKKGEEEVYIHAEKDQNNIVENDETTSVGHDRTEDVGNNETISIGVNRTETVGSNETISIGSNRSVTIGSNKTETIAINKAETIGAAKELTIGGLYQVTVGGLMNETVALAKAQEVGLTKATVVGGNVTETYKSGQTVSVSKDLTESIGKNHNTTVTDDNTINVGKDQIIKVGKNLVIDAGDSVVIKTGKASITMKEDGTIHIDGKDISVTGSGGINVKATNDITMKGKKILQN